MVNDCFKLYAWFTFQIHSEMQVLEALTSRISRSDSAVTVESSSFPAGRGPNFTVLASKYIKIIKISSFAPTATSLGWWYLLSTMKHCVVSKVVLWKSGFLCHIAISWTTNAKMPGGWASTHKIHQAKAFYFDSSPAGAGLRPRPSIPLAGLSPSACQQFKKEAPCCSAKSEITWNTSNIMKLHWNNSICMVIYVRTYK